MKNNAMPFDTGWNNFVRKRLTRNLSWVLFVIFCITVSAQNPVKLAVTARFDLMASAEVGALTDGAFIEGGGSIFRMNWIPLEDQVRSYTCERGISPFEWSSFSFQFTPRNSGTIDLSLMGPWELSSEPGQPIFRQEVLWDSLEATNAQLGNGGFESVQMGLPTPWFRPFGDATVESGPIQPVSGTRFARTWHDGQWRQTITVTGGQRVKLQFFSRAQPTTEIGDPHPVKLAHSARIDLLANPSVGSINKGIVLQGSGGMLRMNWIPVEDQARSYTCEFSIIPFGWIEFAFQFTPEKSGQVDLSLMGPWEPSDAPNQPLFRQEVIWDAISAEGAELLNGSFENESSSGPASWIRSTGNPSVDSGPPQPVDGTNFARTWHEAQWRQTIDVKGGQPVTLRFFSRAQFPDGIDKNPRIADGNSLAHQAKRKFMRGVNLGNYLEAPAGENWGQMYFEEDFAQIRAEGFDHVRIPVQWNAHTGPGPDFIIDQAFASKVDFLINTAARHGLSTIVNIHHFDEFTTDPVGQTPKFIRLWEQLATRYSDQLGNLAFELLNEPKDNATTAILNPIYAETIRRIRLVNPNRTLFIGPGKLNSISELSELVLPGDDDNLIVTVHSYDPFLFTHQGATWAGDAPLTTGIFYPGPPLVPKMPISPSSNLPWVLDWFEQYNCQSVGQNPSSNLAFEGNLQIAKAWSDYYGRPVDVGEFGCYEVADPISRANYYREMREAMDRVNLGWAMWDWKAGFKYWDSHLWKPVAGIREALFPSLKIRSLGLGSLQVPSAIGRRHRVLRATHLGMPESAWIVLYDETLSVPTLDFVDPDPPSGQAFYRVEWVR